MLRASWLSFLIRAACCAGLVVAGSSRHLSAQEAAVSQPNGPLSVSEAQALFQLPDDLTIELVACEPEVVDPVAMRFDERGRLWVVEMSDYPHGPPEGAKPQSRIRYLEDRDRDGRYETSHVFADELLFPTGLQPWRDGLIVTLAGEVIFLRDTGGDGRADERTVWFTGFAQENSQLRANHPTLALDNHIYIANGLRGGAVRDVRRAEAPVAEIRSRDFRFDPLAMSYEPASGLGQFGLTFDDFGRRFVCSNRNPARHVVLEDRYLARNPAFVVPEVVHDVAQAGEQSKLYPLSRAWTTSTLHANQFTAACGVHIYRGTALPAGYRDSVYTCDPTGNLVHRELMRPSGATFVSQPAEEGREFLATRDEWFRPVNLEAGPDGALYVVDMYRAVIEHPQFMPDELKTRRDLRHGDDRGRIWRIRAKEAPRDATAPWVATQSPVSPDELFAQLAHPNAWQRETAARLILQAADRAHAEGLRKLATSAQLAATRARALWLLQALSALSPDDLTAALRDGHPGVREQALMLSELQPGGAVAREQLLQLTADDDPRVRFQAALSLIPIASSEEAEALAQVALRGAADPWTRRAVLLASGERAGEVARSVWQKMIDHDQGLELAAGVTLSAELAQTAGRVSPPSVELLAATLAESKTPAGERMSRAAFAGLVEAWQARKVNWRELAAAEPELLATAERRLTGAAQQALNRELAVALRLEALDLVRFQGDATTIRELVLRSDDEAAVRAKALGLAPQISEPEFWSELLDRFTSESPAIRSAILSAVLARTATIDLLLEQIEAGRIRPQEIAATDFVRLERLPDPKLKERVAQIAAQRTPENRKLALTRFEPCLTLEADPARGRVLFGKTCAACHRIGGLGVDVAPDIADSRTKTPQQLLADILQPNRAIDGNYIGYIVQTTDGRTLTGIISSETATSITLRQAENKIVTLPRTDIDVIQSTGLSLMPEGLEQDMELQDMADLISFIKNWRYLDGSIPLAP